MAPAGLEARYRRLLRWYPADHRAVHRDEMLGVLMAATPRGRDRPTLGESADLLMGAVRIRLRPGRALLDRNGWRDTLAVYSIAGPVLVLASAFLCWLAAWVWSILGHTGGLTLSLGNGAFEDVESAHPVIGTLLWLLLAGQGIVAVLALAGLRRYAATAAALYVLYFGTYVVIRAADFLGFPGIALSMPLQVVAPVTTLVALLASTGPQRGGQLMQRRHWACLAAGSVAGAALIGQLSAASAGSVKVALAAAASLTGIAVINQPGGLLLSELLGATAAAAVVLLLAAAWLSSAHGKRLAVLFGVLAFPALLQLADTYGPVTLAAANVIAPGCQALALCLLAVMVYRTRRQSRPADGGPGEGLV
jgi:hypothetical protein